MCDCGEPRQTVKHLAFECPLVSECPLEVSAWRHRHAAQSAAFLCPLPVNRDDRDVWRLACRRVIRVLSNLAVPEPVFDWRGHVVVPECQGEYVFCIHCLATRKAKDAKHLPAKVCPRELWGSPCAEGSYLRRLDHFFRLDFLPWKRASRRPGFTCVKCHLSTWPPYPPRCRCQA